MTISEIAEAVTPASLIDDAEYRDIVDQVVVAGETGVLGDFMSDLKARVAWRMAGRDYEGVCVLLTVALSYGAILGRRMDR